MCKSVMDESGGSDTLFVASKNFSRQTKDEVCVFIEILTKNSIFHRATMDASSTSVGYVS
jgi:hypothetical protein